MESGTQRPLILGYDGSAGARHAIERGAAALTTRRAFALHVLESAGGVEPATEDRALTLAREGAELAREAGLAAEPLVVRCPAGGVADEIIAVADTHDADGIVVGSRGLSGLSSALLGSVSTAVVHGSGRPVLVVPPPVG